VPNFEVVSDKFNLYRILSTKFFTKIKTAVSLQYCNSTQYEVMGCMKLPDFVGLLSDKVMPHSTTAATLALLDFLIIKIKANP
jgi:hypothetical protein